MTDMAQRWHCPSCDEGFTDLEMMRVAGMCPEDGTLLVREPGELQFAPQPMIGSGDEVPVRRGNRADNQRARSFMADSTPFSPAAIGNCNLNTSKDAGDTVCLQIVPVKGQKREVASIMQLLNALSGVKPISFEIAGLKNERLLLIRCDRKHVALVKGQVTSVYGSPEIIEVPPDADPFTQFGQAKHRSLSTLELVRPEALPLRTYLELERNDPIMPITGASFDLSAGEVSLSQLVVHAAAPEDWAASYRKELLAIRRRNMGLLSGRNYYRLIFLCLALGVASLSAYNLYWQAWGIALILGVVAAVFFALGIRLFRLSDVEWSESQEEMVARKIEMPAYQVELRIAAGAGSRNRAEEIIRALANAYKVFSMEAGNSLVPIPQNPNAVGSNGLQICDQEGTNLLGDEEIATLWHLPIVDMPDMMEISRVSHVLPDKWQVANDQEGWYIGEAQKSAGTPIPVWLPRSTARSHMLLLGRTGMGKTTTLERIITHIAAKPDHSLVLVDPHGDMARRMLGLIPRERVEDVRFLDFSDPNNRPAFNPFDLSLYEGDAEQAALAMKEISREVFSRFWGPRMAMPFENAALAITLMNSLVPTEEQYTIMNMLSLLELPSNVRQHLLKNRLPPEDLLTQSIIQFFKLHYDNLTKSFQEQVVMPVISKIEPYRRNTTLQTIFGQSQCSFNLVDDIRNGKIFILRTASANLSRNESNFLGSLFLNIVIRAIYSQIDMPEEERTQVTIVVDESQTYSGVDYGRLLAEMRKFGANAILSVQGPSTIGRASASDEQDDPYAFQKIMENVDALFVFRTSGQTAEELVKTEFSNEATASDLQYLEKFQSFVRFAAGRKVSGPFKVNLAPPLLPDALTEADIIAHRSTYLLSKEEAILGAKINKDRLDAVKLTDLFERSGGVSSGELTDVTLTPELDFEALSPIDNEAGIETILNDLKGPFAKAKGEEPDTDKDGAAGSSRPQEVSIREIKGLGADDVD